jgi:hypothetical protein
MPFGIAAGPANGHFVLVFLTHTTTPQFLDGRVDTFGMGCFYLKILRVCQ